MANVFTVETTSKILGRRRVCAMAYNGIPYSIRPGSKEVRLRSREDAEALVEKIKRLAGYKAEVIELERETLIGGFGLSVEG